MDRRALIVESPEVMLAPILARMEIEARKSPEQKARDREAMRQWLADLEARAREYRREKPEGRAAQRRLRQLARQQP